MPNELVRLPDLLFRHPDQRRSDSREFCSAIGSVDYIWAVEVRGQGALVLRSRGSDPVTGRLKVGVCLFTTEEILFDSE
jgi:hypothetical protein